ncbi:uncharacterized protein TRIREDRAFT_109416 [Trichoderma reesei QM6a]|uniref:Predicted protein n=2 Tax=Hypocrea jecorina TaxID=51453 RepID=G0RPH3_HYPJQ|nr:uncharacterized protein TRIREDRAFT_109416 [Trichoderma reesei QM6a]EGR47136.1 predicted protein [Trichoderma reesei QM6a]
MPVAEADAEAAASPVVGASPSARNDDSTTEAADRPVASTPSTPTTATSPVSPTFLSVAGRVSTPLSLFVDSAPSSGNKKKNNSNRLLPLSPSSPTSPGSETAAELRQRYLAMSPTASGGGALGTRDGASMLAEDGTAEAERMRQRALQEEQEKQQQQDKAQNLDETGWREKSTGTTTGADSRTGPPLPWSPSSSTSISNSTSAGNLDSNINIAASSSGDIDKHGSGRSRGVISAPLPQSPNARARRGQHERPSTAARDSDIATSITGRPDLRASNNNSSRSGAGNHITGAATSPGSATARIPAPEDAPLHTGSVQPGTRLAHPKPILHIATDVSSPSRLSHHADLLTRSASAVSNVAHLEATAERLSMTSSIDDAIRELHCELKRSDSRRSSILAARAASAADDSNNPNPNSTRLRRHPSNSNSTSSAAAAARQRGYSPAYVMSPTSSLSGRMRSGSNASAGRPEHDAINSILSRHGPGKSSVRSVRSAKPSLAEISESEPISLTQHVLDQVDAVPPAEQHAAASSRSIIEQDAVGLPHTDEFHDMLEGGFRSHRASNLVLVNPDLPSGSEYDETEHDRDAYDDRPMTANSTNTFQVAQDAFVDFDGAHCETDTEDDRFASTADMGEPSHKREGHPDMHQHQQPHLLPQLPQSYSQDQAHAHAHAQSSTLPPILDDDHLPTPQPPATEFVRPQSYFDEHTGQHMLYYPARVPAMLNLPPKLSNKPKAADRNQRRSQLLDAMMQPKRKSVVPDLDKITLPDPLSGHRNSFAALSVADGLGVGDDATTPTGWFEEASAQVGGGHPPSLEDLRHPQRLSKMDKDKHKSTGGGLNLPPHLRASVFFEQPSELPEIEVKDGSAMATLDSILDASATAPVSAFTDHLYAGKLGSEVYGKAKTKKTKKKDTKRKSQQLDVPSAESGSKEKSTIKLLTKRSQSSLFGKASSNADPAAAQGDGHGDAHDEESEEEESEEEEEQLENGVVDGVPTTLLGELHLRKQQQKQRVLNNGNVATQGLRATLLEMDAVAEMQRKQRLKSRVNLAWEDQAAAAEHNLSDDEDVPLAVIAALHQGAKNMADVERPLGLMEVRQLEENEPLSQRAARLKGRTSIAMTAKRQSNLSLPPTRIAEVQPPAPSPRIVEPDVRADEDARTTIATPEPLAPEIEEETLGARKRRLAESQLPKARPVSSTFSMELLSQFGGPDEPENKSSGKKSPNNLGVEDETLGQRRRRLQAEREAREREMSYGNLTGERPVSYGNTTNLQAGKGLARRVSMADMLSVHQNIQDPRVEEQRRRQQEQMRIAEQDARMAAVRAQMPTTLIQPGNARTGGFKGGLYNDGTGGLGLEGARSSVALNTLQTRSFTNTGPARNRATMMVPPTTGYGMSQGVGLQPSYSTMTGFHGGMGGMNTMSMYGAGNLYGANGLINQGIPMSNPNGSMDRVERWRQGVFP